jgi:hypothetical protein
MKRILFFVVMFMFLLLIAGAKAITLQVGVFSDSEYTSQGCKLNLTQAVVSIRYNSNQSFVTSQSPSNILSHCCYSGGNYYDCYVAIFDLANDTYNVTATATGYVGESTTIVLDTGKGTNFFLAKLDTWNIFLNVRDSLTLAPITTIIPCLYFSNGTQVPTLGGFTTPNCNVVTSYSGFYDMWRGVPTGSYYYTVRTSGYALFNSGTFSLTADRTDTVGLSASPMNVFMIADKSSGLPGDTFTFNVSISNGLPAFTNRLYVKDPSGNVILYQSQHGTSSFSVPVIISTYGNNDVYTDVTDSTDNTVESNHITINIGGGGTIPTTPISGINVTEWQENGWGWALPIFTPIFIFTFGAGVISGILAAISGNAGGVIGGITWVAFMMLYTLMGIYPSWVGIVLIILSGGVTVMFMGKMLGWGR